MCVCPLYVQALFGCKKVELTMGRCKNTRDGGTCPYGCTTRVNACHKYGRGKCNCPACKYDHVTPRRPTAEDKGYLSVSEDDAVPNTASADDSVVKPSGLQLQAQPLATPSSASADGFDTEVEVISRRRRLSFCLERRRAKSITRE